MPRPPPDDLGITVELGTKGIEPGHLERFLRLAEVFDARLVRSMLYGPDSRAVPRRGRGAAALRHRRGTRHPVSRSPWRPTSRCATADLVALIERVGDDHLGVCLDPANVVARVEHPRDCVELTAAHVKNVHVKDFAFARQPGWVGFTYGGAVMGEGLHDYPHLLDDRPPASSAASTRSSSTGCSWQGDPETTIRTERDWTRATIEYLRSTS